MMQFLRNEDGQGMVEYTLVIMLIAMAVIIGFRNLGISIDESIRNSAVKVGEAHAAK